MTFPPSKSPVPVSPREQLAAVGPWLVLGLVLLGVGVASWRPVPAGVWHDDGTYMLIGKALAGGHGFTYDGVAGSPPATKFPPVYPLTLAGLWSIFGAIGPATMAATFLNVILIALAGALFGRALHEGAGLPILVAALTGGLAMASGDVLRTALVPLSEPLFLLLCAGSLVLWPGLDAAVRDTDRPLKEHAGRIAAVAAVLLAAVATRSAGVALVAAFAAALLVPKPDRRRVTVTAWIVGPAALFFQLWGRWSARATREIPEGARDLLGPYGGWLQDQVFSAPGTFVAELPTHGAGVLGRAVALLVPGVAGWPMWVLGGLAMVPAFTGLVVLLRRCAPLAWFVVLYLGMLLLWPYLDRRLLVPLHPALLGVIAVGGRELVRRAGATHLRTALLASAAVWTLGYSTVTAYRIADGWPSAPYRVRAERLAAAVEAMTRTVPPDAVVGAPEFWAALHLHGGWTVSPSVRFDPRSVDPETPMWGTPDEQITLWRAAGIDHLLLEQAGQLHGAALDQLEEGCPGSVFVLAQMRGAMVVKLDWGADCPPALPSTPRSPDRNTPG